MPSLLRAAQAACHGFEVLAAAAAATAATAATAAGAAAPATLRGPSQGSLTALQGNKSPALHQGPPASLFVSPLLRAQATPTGVLSVDGPHRLLEEQLSSSGSSNNNSSTWFAFSLGVASQHRQSQQGTPLSLPVPSGGLLPWGPPLLRFPLPLWDPILGPPLHLPTEAPRRVPPADSRGSAPVGWAPPSVVPIGVPPSVTPLGGPQIAEGEGDSGYLCNKVRNDKSYRKRGFVQRGYWGRQRRLQLKHERLRLAFAYQGVDLLKLKSLKWGEVWKGPWGSAKGG